IGADPPVHLVSVDGRRIPGEVNGPEKRLGRLEALWRGKITATRTRATADRQQEREPDPVWLHTSPWIGSRGARRGCARGYTIPPSAAGVSGDRCCRVNDDLCSATFQGTSEATLRASFRHPRDTIAAIRHWLEDRSSIDALRLLPSIVEVSIQGDSSAIETHPLPRSQGGSQTRPPADDLRDEAMNHPVDDL